MSPKNTVIALALLVVPFLLTTAAPVLASSGGMSSMGRPA